MFWVSELMNRKFSNERDKRVYDTYGTFWEDFLVQYWFNFMCDDLCTDKRTPSILLFMRYRFEFILYVNIYYDILYHIALWNFSLFRTRFVNDFQRQTKSAQIIRI